MTGALDYEALRAAWENFAIVKEHGQFVTKTVTQVERLVYTDDPSKARPAAFRDDRTWTRKSEKSKKDSVDMACVARMHCLLERDKTLALRVAAARVAVEFWVSGHTFGAVVRRLARAYQRSRPILLSRALSGDISEAWTNRRHTEKVPRVMKKVREYNRS